MGERAPLNSPPAGSRRPSLAVKSHPLRSLSLSRYCFVRRPFVHTLARLLTDRSQVVGRQAAFVTHSHYVRSNLNCLLHHQKPKKSRLAFWGKSPTHLARKLSAALAGELSTSAITLNTLGQSLCSNLKVSPPACNCGHSSLFNRSL